MGRPCMRGALRGWCGSVVKRGFRFFGRICDVDGARTRHAWVHFQLFLARDAIGGWFRDQTPRSFRPHTGCKRVKRPRAKAAGDHMSPRRAFVVMLRSADGCEASTGYQRPKAGIVWFWTLFSSAL